MDRILILIVVVTGILLLMKQITRKGDLEREIETEESNRRTLSTRSGGRASPLIKNDRWAGDRAVEILAFVESHQDHGGSFDLVDIVSEATAEELAGIISQLGASSETPRIEAILWQLRTMREELDPESTLREKYDPRIFQILARRSPEAALRWLEEAEFSDEKRRKAMQIFDSARVVIEPSKYFDRWAELQKDFRWNVILLDPSVLPELSSAINRPENVGARDALILSLVRSAMFEGAGVARSHAESLGLGAEDLASAFTERREFESAELLDWMAELGKIDPQIIDPVMPYSLARFALRDLEGAAAWLDDFEGPQAIRDDLTQRYSYVLGAVDPRASLEWINKIEDVEKRRQVSREVLYAWEYEDPRSFAEWKTGQ